MDSICILSYSIVHSFVWWFVGETKAECEGRLLDFTVGITPRSEIPKSIFGYLSKKIVPRQLGARE